MNQRILLTLALLSGLWGMSAEAAPPVADRKSVV